MLPIRAVSTRSAHLVLSHRCRCLASRGFILPPRLSKSFRKYFRASERYSYAATSSLAAAALALVSAVTTATVALEGVDDAESSTATDTCKDPTSIGVTDFLHFLNSHGVSISQPADGQHGSKFCITNKQGKGSAAMLNDPSAYTDDEVVATIPQNIIIDIDTLQDEDGPASPYFRDWLREKLADEKDGPLLTERRVLMLYYLCEGHTSPYLRTFPRLPTNEDAHDESTFPTKDDDATSRAPIPPLFWPKEERQRLLHDTEIDMPLVAKEKALRGEWENCIHRWLVELKSLENDNNTAATNAVGFRDFCWADSLFWTRVLKYKNQGFAASYHWVPLVDACNHSYAPTCYWESDAVGNVHLRTKVESGVEEAAPIGPIELCYTYGEKSNAELLFSHGFCVDNNPNECVTWSLLEKDSALTDTKSRLLRALQLQPRISMHRLSQEFDFGANALRRFDLLSIYVLFILVLEDDEIACGYETGGDGPFFVCQVKGATDSKMRIKTYDDFEEFCDEQCDALMPRVLLFLDELIDYKMQGIRETTCYRALLFPDAPMSSREGFVRQLLHYQLKLLSELRH